MGQQRGKDRAAVREELLQEAVVQFERTLELDPENVTAHFNLELLHGALGNSETQAHHRRLHLRYKSDDNARGQAVAAARSKDPAADIAAEALVIYEL